MKKTIEKLKIKGKNTKELEDFPLSLFL